MPRRMPGRKPRRFAVVLAAALCAAAAATHASDGADVASSEGFAREVGAWMERARTLAVDGDHAGAQAAVDSALALDPRHFGARLLRARLLSWQGRYGAAESQLSTLLQERPGDVEAGLALAYLRYYEGRLAESEAEFETVLRASPQDGDALEGISRVRAALRARAAPPRRWRVDAGLEYSDFARVPQDAWHQQFVQAARLLDDGATTVHARLETYRRFGLDDIAVEAGVARVFSPRLHGAVAAGWTFASDFRPEWRAVADVGFLAMPARTPGGPTAWLLGAARYDAYAEVDVLGLQPGVRLAQGHWAGTARIAQSTEFGASARDGALYGWSVRLDGPVRGDGPVPVRFFAGLADAPETVARAATVSTVTTTSVFGGLVVQFPRDWQVSVAYARDDREDSYIRHGYNFSVSRRY